MTKRSKSRWDQKGPSIFEGAYNGRSLEIREKPQLWDRAGDRDLVLPEGPSITTHIRPQIWVPELHCAISSANNARFLRANYCLQRLIPCNSDKDCSAASRQFALPEHRNHGPRMAVRNLRHYLFYLATNECVHSRIRHFSPATATCSRNGFSHSRFLAA
jgi:hypothetical protein